MTALSLCLYFPGEPAKLFSFLDSVAPYAAANGMDPKSIELLLFIDNDDHKVSTEFYALRRYIRKGLNVQVFINPSLENSDKVFEFLSEKSTGDGVIVNNGFYTSIEQLVDRDSDPIAVFKTFSPPPEAQRVKR